MQKSALESGETASAKLVVLMKNIICNSIHLHFDKHVTSSVLYWDPDGCPSIALCVCGGTTLLGQPSGSQYSTEDMTHLSQNVSAQSKILLFHALFSWLTEDYKEAELFFTAVTTFYPHFPEGWFAFKLFAEETEQPYVASVAHMAGMKCLHNRLQDSKNSNNESGVFLSWSPLISENDRPFILTAVLLLKLGFPELAEIALSCNLSEQGEPTAVYLYLLAVSHYIQGRHEESNSHLTQATHLDWENSHIWALIGHNYYKMGQKQEAQNAYKFVIESVNRPTDIPLTYLRYGLCLMEVNDYPSAKEMFLLACTHGPSPLSWLALGTACYMLSDMEDAEMALSEANMLDHRLATVWAYLALINLHMCHEDCYKHCYAQAMTYGLNDPELLNKIHKFKGLLSSSD